MLFFNFCLIGFVAFFSVFLKKNTKIQNLLFGFLVIYLIVFAGTRVGVGKDYYSYETLYSIIKRGIFTRHELFFIWACKLSPNFRFLLMFMAFLSISLKAKIIKEYSYFPILSLFLYLGFSFYKDEMSGIRIGAACAIAFQGFKYLKKEEYVKYTINILFASLMHRSILFYLLLIPFSKIKLNCKKINSMLLTSFFIGQINFNKLMRLVLNKIPFIRNKYNYAFEGFRAERIGLTMGILLLMIITVFFAINYKKLSRLENFELIFRVYFFGVIFYLLFNSFLFIATRGSEMFTYVSYILIPYSLKCYYSKNNKLILLGIIVVYNLYYNFLVIDYKFYDLYKSSLF